MSIKHLISSGILAGVLFLVAAPVNAGVLTQAIYINTSSLTGLGTFSLAFQLADGSGTGDANNTVRLFDFNLMGGVTGAAADFTAGGATGSLSTEVDLVDSDPFFNALVQGFTPGQGVKFMASFTNNTDAGFFPDLFAISILGPDGFGIPTLDPAGNDTFVTVLFDGRLGPDAVGVNFPGQFYGSDPARTTFDIPTPAAVPEPMSLAMLVGGIAVLGLRKLRA